MRSTQILLCFLQLHYFHVFSIRTHENTNEITTTVQPNIATTTVVNHSELGRNETAANSTLNLERSLKETINGSIRKDGPLKKAKPDLIVIKKKKLIAKHAIGSVSGDNINSANPSIGTDNDESKETKNFVPSPELSEDFSDTSITHDTYPGSDLSENNPSNFVPSTNPLIITQTYAPAIAGVRQKYHSHIGRLPMWPYPYENIDSKFKWKILSPEQSHKDDGKILFPTEETTVSGKSTIYSEYPSKTTSSAPNSLHQPFAYDAPISSFSPLPTPFSYTTTRESQTSDIEPTRDNRLPPWMEMLHIKNNEYDAFKAPIEYYAKAIQNQPNHALINHQPHYGFTHIDKNVLWHSVFKFLATAVPIGLVISALSPNVVTVNADSSPRLNGTVSRMNNTLPYFNMMVASQTGSIDCDC